MEILKNLANLVKVKTLVTLAVMAVFCALSLQGKITADNVMIVVTTVIAFFLGNTLMFCFGGVAGAFTGTNDIFWVMIELGLGIWAFLVLGANIWTTNDTLCTPALWAWPTSPARRRSPWSSSPVLSAPWLLCGCTTTSATG